MAAFVQESELVSFFIYRPELGRKEGTVRNPQEVIQGSVWSLSREGGLLLRIECIGSMKSDAFQYSKFLSPDRARRWSFLIP